MANLYLALKQEKIDLLQESHALFDRAEQESRDLSDAEKARDDAIVERLAAVNDGLARWERQHEREREMPALAGAEFASGSPATAPTSYPTPFGSFGEQLVAIRNAALGRPDERLFKVAALGAGEAQDPDGGFLVQMDFASEIMRIMTQNSEVLTRCRRLPIGANANRVSIPYVDETSRATGSRWGGVQGYWVDEGTAPTASKPRVNRIELRLHKLAALGYATDELLEDAVAMESLFTQAFADELLWLTENAILNGGGAGSPLGVLNAACAISIAKEAGQAAATVLYENLVKMWARMHARSRGNAVWFINQDVEPQLDQLFLAAGVAGIPPRFVDYGPDSALRIKGRPVVPVEYCQTVGTVGDIILADMSQYAVIDKGAVEQAQSLHLKFDTDEIAFRATYRVDGQPMWKAALTPANGSNTLSPFITLATRA